MEKESEFSSASDPEGEKVGARGVTEMHKNFYESFSSRHNSSFTLRKDE